MNNIYPTTAAEDEADISALVKVAMQVVIDAGNARIASEQALKKLRTFDFANANRLMQEASVHLQSAHDAQTEVIQSEAAGTRYENSFLFNHAQDTLMTAMTQYHLTEEIIELYRILYGEIRRRDL